MMTKRAITLLAIGIPAFVGVALIAYSVLILRYYGLGIFVGTPFLVGLAAAWLQAKRGKRGLLASVASAIGAITLMGCGVLVFALDGAICILMSMPLAGGIATVGGLAGFYLGKLGAAKTGAFAHLVLVSLLTVGMSGEESWRDKAKERSVTTSIGMKSAIHDVWSNVIEFAPISEDPTGIFRFGIAYPVGAHIEGQGVGAVRYCEFSTGSFVEPIRVWEEPTWLAFDVVENPVPMREWSIYRDLEVPHLHGTFISKRGEFRLASTPTGTVLSGTTWYEQRMWPEWYWGAISDAIIHRIHRRVLIHIKKSAEG